MTLLSLCVSLLFSFEESILYLCGASDLSDVPEEMVEKLRSLERHPLRINFATDAALSGSGLFSAYQIASLRDYRERSGDVLSPAELGAVDGFSAEFVSFLVGFLSFEATGTGRELWLSERPKQVDIQTSGGFAAKAAEGKGALRWMGKAAVEYGGFAASVAARTPWSLPVGKPEAVGWSASYSGHRFSAVVGRFHARFGQGLMLWSGVNFNAFTSAQSLMKKPSGLAAYQSYALDGTMYGAAARIYVGGVSISPFADVGGRRWGGNVAWNHRSGQVGATVLHSGGRLVLSADFQHTIRGVTLYGEVTSLGSVVLGTRFTAGRVDAGLRMLYSPDEHAVMAAASCLTDDRIHNFGLSGGVAYKDRAGQIRSQASYSASIDSSWSFAVRASVRLKPSYAKVGIRQDAGWKGGGGWSVALRGDVLHCIDWAWLGALETGFVPSRLGVYVQVGVFRIDNWDDRIYVYRRDAPGGYNIPAMYGRGWWIAQYAVFKPGRWGRVYLRSEYTAYPWARPGDTRKRPSAGAAVQVSVDLSYFRKTKNTAATRQPKATR